MAAVVVVKDSKHAGERRFAGFNLTTRCMRVWAAGEFVALNTVVRPLPKEDGGLKGSDGFQYRATTEGQTGEREPVWGPDPIVDGSVNWVREALSNDSLYKRIADPNGVEWLTDPDGPMTVDDQTQVNNVSVQIGAFHSGGEEGATHRVIARVTFTDGSREDFAIDWEIVEDGLPP